MRNTFILTIIFLFLISIEIFAQSFDGDSIHYTPIPIKTGKQVSKNRIFRDTIKNEPLFKYFFNLQTGTLIGCSDCSEGKKITFTSSTTHGVTIGKKIRAGAGIGFDSYYNWQTMPLFGSISFDLLGTKNTSALFVQFNYGWSEAWRNKQVEDYGLTGTRGGRMSTILVGYRIKYHDVRISFSVGNKYQRVSTYFEYPTYIYKPDGTWVLGTPSTESIEESMRRLMFSMTVGWK